MGESTTDPQIFDVESVGLATYFLAIGYFAFAFRSTVAMKHISSFISLWNAQKFFHFFICVHLYVRTLAFTSLSVFALVSDQQWYPLTVMMYTLPEFLMLSLYFMLCMFWLEIYIFAHEQFIYTSKAAFKKTWKASFIIFSFIMYGILAGLYTNFAIHNEGGTEKNNEAHRKSLSFIEYSAGVGCILLPLLFGTFYYYWSQWGLSGFPFKTSLARHKVKRVNWVVLVWSVGRLVRGTVYIVSIIYEWERKLGSTALSMIIVASLLFCEFMPLYLTLDWSIVGILILGEERDNLLSSDAQSSTGLLSGETSSITTWIDSDSDSYHLDSNKLQLGGELVNDDGFSFKQRGIYGGKLVGVTGFRFQANYADDSLLDELSVGVVRASVSDHPNILEFIGVCRVRTILYVVYKYMHGHTLQEVIHRTLNPFFFETLVSITYQIALGLQYIHHKGSQSVHGNLTSRNIMLDGELDIKIGALGYLRLCKYAEIMLVRRMVTAYSAPEVLRGKTATQASDVYSFGIIFWELVTRKAPFEGQNISKIRDLVLNKRHTLPLPQELDLHPTLTKMMLECWSYDPVNRPDINTIVEELGSLQH